MRRPLSLSSSPSSSSRVFLLFVLLLSAASALSGQTTGQVLVVTNKRSVTSREISDYYVRKRGIPLANVCSIETEPQETITRQVYNTQVEGPVAAFLKAHSLQEKILYIVLTSGVPLRIKGPGDAFATETASVDSELTLLYPRMKGVTIPVIGPVPNPFFRQSDTPFRHPTFPLYLVTRLDGYNMADMKALVDRALRAKNTGTFVIDLKARDTTEGNQWLRTAALLLPKERIIMDETATVLSNVKGVIGYASWGSNDTDRKHRLLHLEWLPGAIATEFVSTNARTFRQPPANWELGGLWTDPRALWAGSPQSMTADYIHEGASGASGQIDEPYLTFCPRPDFVLPAYKSGRNLAESFYLGMPALSWMNVVIGDPLMHLQ
jgi:uncharacterized protein (TIGR03790 family)